VTLLALLRHAATAWNEEHRLQGRCDPPLSAVGRKAALSWRVPPALAHCRWLSSPLRRAVETAHLLGIAEPLCDARLAEMSWGDWEGERLAELRARYGVSLARREAAGLDFAPPAGESPRQVQNRLAPLLAEIARRGQPTAALTHKGVIRAVYALATRWDMRGKPQHRLSWSAAHLFRLDPHGRPSVECLNLPLAPP
jgi:probable phosphoglycerate mutase